MKSAHEEVDTIIVQKKVAAANQKDISVISDNTDVFVFLLYDYLAQQLKPPIITESPKAVPKHSSL